MSIESIKARAAEWDGEVVPDKYRTDLTAFSGAVAQAVRDRAALLAVAEAASECMDMWRGLNVSPEYQALIDALAALEAEP